MLKCIINNVYCISLELKIFVKIHVICGCESKYSEERTKHVHYHYG